MIKMLIVIYIIKKKFLNQDLYIIYFYIIRKFKILEKNHFIIFIILNIIINLNSNV
jgi:hypothetical protein